MSTEPAVKNGTGRRDDSCYKITPPVRVREETFGLLFYDTDNSRLTFVKSGDLLKIRNLPHGVKGITVDMKTETQAKVRKLIDQLLKKRLIRES